MCALLTLPWTEQGRELVEVMSTFARSFDADAFPLLAVVVIMWISNFGIF